MRNGIREEITGFRNQIAVFVGLGASTVENSVIVILLIISNAMRSHCIASAEENAMRCHCNGSAEENATRFTL